VQVFSCIGRFVDENGDGVAGVAMRVVDWQAFVDTRELIASPRATSADDGTFSIDYELVKGGAYLVFAAAGRQAGRVSIDQIPGFALAPIVLPPGSQVTGRVRDVDGRPLVGVHVTIGDACKQTLVNAACCLHACATTDEKGIFTVPCTAEAGLRLTANHDGYLGVQRLCARDSALDLTLTKAELVRGVLVDVDGEPVAGIRIVTETTGWFERPPHLGVTAADGSFTTCAPPAGIAYRLSAYGPGVHVASEHMQGAREDVHLQLQRRTGAGPFELRVRVRARGGADIDEFSITRLTHYAHDLQMALANGPAAPQAFTSEAVIRGDRLDWQGLLVEAEGHAFAAVPLPEDTSEPLVVELGDEAVITGTARDEHGQPAVGVSVRALPKGPAFGGRGPIREWWPKTDANGRFRIGGLRAGEYGVQLYAVDRTSTRPVFVTATTSNPVDVDLQLRAPIVAQFDVNGEVPRGPAPLLSVGMEWHGHSEAGWFRHTLRQHAPLAIRGAGRYSIGPLHSDRVSIHLFAPSRTRIGAGCELLARDLTVEPKPQPLVLPDLQRARIEGRVAPLQKIPLDRVAVLATPKGVARTWNVVARRSCIAGVCANGHFVLDLPAGNYWLQLADLQTGIVFHTEPGPQDPRDGQLVLRPNAHLLTLACDSGREDAAPHVSSIHVQFSEGGKNEPPRFLSYVGPHQTTLPWPTGAREQTWIVPAGDIELTATHWRSHANGGGEWVVSDSAELTIERDHTRVVLNAPPTPTEQSTRDK